ncbi:bifunctional DNA-formamidopyrimidine glycosylase/DNA-(apurinic or apyrimidinic site) lyase, partial [bacterium]|nr:bifunctional DNA-formamidopyrimidine glycosylase/DNA-(apurinic or apyrimidinic site) lyase [bacterium]
RGKYIIFQLDNGAIIMHLGMSGRVKILNEFIEPEKHAHVDIVFNDGIILRYTDPRRFGTILWTFDDIQNHPLLKQLGPEPLENHFTAEYLSSLAKNRSLPIKSFIMDSKVVVGVGNIYATEALFTSNIHPLTPAKLVSKDKMKLLVMEIKATLSLAIEAGGTTLKDFLGSDGKPGYFVQKLKAYGRAGSPCINCQTLLKSLQIGQRTTTFCDFCQPLEH